MADVLAKYLKAIDANTASVFKLTHAALYATGRERRASLEVMAATAKLITRDAELVLALLGDRDD